MLGERTLPGQKGVLVYGKVAIMRYRSVSQVIIPEGVEEIGEDGFSTCNQLQWVSFPSSLRIIGRNAFYCCWHMELSRVSDGVREIRDEAFANCSSIRFFRFPSGLQKLGTGVFQEAGLIKLRFPRWMVKIPERTCRGCQMLDEVVLPQSLVEIGGQAFQDCTRLQQIDLPDTLRILGRRAFSGSVLQKLNLPEGLEEIGEYCFSGCTGLEEVGIPASVSRVDGSAFSACSALKAFQVDPANRTYSSLEGMLLADGGRTLIACPGGRSGVVKLPDTVRHIARGAFWHCNGVTEIHIPAGVTAEPESILHCDSLHTVRLGGSLEGYDWLSRCSVSSHDGDEIIVDNPAIIAPDISVLDVPESLRIRMLEGFLRCRRRGEDFPFREQYLEYIRRRQRKFWRQGICRDVMLQEGLLSVATYLSAVQATDSRQDPEGMARLLEYRRRFFAHGEVEEYQEKKQARDLRAITRATPTAAELRKIFRCEKTDVPRQEVMRSYWGRETEVVIPGKIGLSSIVEIGPNAFSRQEIPALVNIEPLVRSVTVSEGVVSLAEYAFAGLNCIAKVNLPDSLRTIGNHAFQVCPELRSLTIPAGVKSITEDVLETAWALETVTFLGDTEILPFYEDPHVQEVPLPDECAGRKLTIIAPPGSPALAWAAEQGYIGKVLPAGRGERGEPASPEPPGSGAPRADPQAGAHSEGRDG